MSDDPFGDDSEDADPGDDPFEDLADQAAQKEGNAEEDGDTEWASDEESLFSDAVDPSGGEAGVGTHGPDPFSEGDDDTESVDDDPFTDLEQNTSGSADAAESDPFEGIESPDDDPFEALEDDGDDVDDTVWDDLSADPESETLSEQRDGQKVSEVSKHRFCEQCPHFTGPPEIRCTYEGSEILEFLDMETVRVADCPIVEEREAMGDVQ